MERLLGRCTVRWPGALDNLGIEKKGGGSNKAFFIVCRDSNVCTFVAKSTSMPKWEENGGGGGVEPILAISGFRKRPVTLHLPWMKCIWRKLPEKNCFLWLFAVRFKFGNCFLWLFYSLAPSLLPQLEVWVAWDSGHNLSSSFYSLCRLLPTFCKSVSVDSQWRQRRFATKPTRVGWPLLQSGRRKESWLVGTFQDCVIQISGPEDLQLCLLWEKSKIGGGQAGKYARYYLLRISAPLGEAAMQTKT